MPSPPMPPMSVQPQLPKESLIVGSERSDAIDLRSRIAARVGVDGARKYFALLGRFLGAGITKPEFDKLCYATLGRENLPLHNQLMRLVLKNACRGIGPPPRAEDRFLAFVEKNGCRVDVGSDNRIGDLVGSKRKVHYGDDKSGERLSKRFQIERSLANMSEPDASISGREDLVQHLCGPLNAPLGMPLFQHNAGGTSQNHWSLLSSQNRIFSSYECGELCDTRTLKERMDRLLAAQGLEGATIECAEVLNNGLNAFLRRLVRSCIELVGARSQLDERHTSVMLKQQLQGRQLNGVSLQSHIHMWTNTKETGYTHGSSECRTISVQDFQVALNINQQINGPNYNSILSKLDLLHRYF